MRRFPRHKTGPDTTRVHRENGFPEGLKRRFFNFTKCCRWNASSASGTRTAQSGRDEENGRLAGPDSAGAQARLADTRRNVVVTAQPARSPASA
jgi:hypothetical protein